MKVVEVKEQVRLPLGRCVELVLSGVKFRLFRAAITVGIIALAVAFLMTMVSESLVGRRVADAVKTETTPRDAMLFWVGRLANELTEEQLAADLAAMADGTRGAIDAQEAAELKAWGRLTGKDLERLTSVGKRQRMYDRFFTRTISESEKRSLVKEAKGADIYRWLQQGANLKFFKTERDRIKKPLPQEPGRQTGPMADFEAFLKDWQETAAMRQAILAGNKPAVAAARKALGGRDPKEALATTEPAAMAATLAACGFQTTPAQMAQVRRQADLSLDVERIENISRAAAFKSSFSEVYGLSPGEMDYDILFDRLSTTRGARWFVEETDKTKNLTDPRMSEARMQEAATSQRPLDEADLAVKLAEASASRDDAAEVKLWGQLTDAQVETLSKLAVREKKYLDFCDVLLQEKRKELLGAPKLTREVLAGLTKEESLAAFLGRLAKIDKDKKFPDDDPAGQFGRFLKEWNLTEPLRQQIRDGREDIARAVAKAVTPALARGEGKALLEAVAAAGLKRPLGPEAAEIVRRQAALTLEAGQLAGLLEARIVREWLGKQIPRPKTSKLTEEEWLRSLTGGQLLSHAADMEGAKRLRSFLDRTTGMQPLGLSSERVKAVAQYWLRDRTLNDIEATVGANLGDVSTWGFSGRTMWLLVVSFMVCVVGIANAMLMSVTERFREIATMKCLGATDGFIMLNFVLESCIQGVAGGVVGTMLGLLLGTLRGAGMYGWIALANYPIGEVLAAAGISLVAGVVISALAAVYPAWVAARLAPMEAMRIE